MLFLLAVTRLRVVDAGADAHGLPQTMENAAIDRRNYVMCGTSLSLAKGVVFRRLHALRPSGRAIHE